MNTTEKKNQLKHLYSLFDQHEESEQKLIDMRRGADFNDRDFLQEYTQSWKEHDALERTIVMYMALWSNKDLKIIRDPALSLTQVIKKLNL